MGNEFSGIWEEELGSLDLADSAAGLLAKGLLKPLAAAHTASIPGLRSWEICMSLCWRIFLNGTQLASRQLPSVISVTADVRGDR
ncbi:hypothetical protein [Cupriavidus sp. UYPR2.512]|uniref:hypothetical protein n=1 Tax=Cupriavidus sp. UYPR2.512 TaxID=1080187 RepID=UPI0018DF4163|nr:hypothetical protein [Cupriavidus sp. UYPR2.512]UIF88296.1 hypothetical protein KAF44_21195 [Cupriavidus necator]